MSLLNLGRHSRYCEVLSGNSATLVHPVAKEGTLGEYMTECNRLVTTTINGGGCFNVFAMAQGWDLSYSYCKKCTTVLVALKFGVFQKIFLPSF